MRKMRLPYGFSVVFACSLLFFTHPAVAATFQKGHVFAAVSNGQVQHYDAAGNLLGTLNCGFGGYTTGMAFDSLGNLYVTEFSNQAMTIFAGPADPHTILNRIATGALGDRSPESIVFDKWANFYVGHADGNADIHKYNLAGIRQAVYNVATERRGSDWIDLAADQKTIFYTSEGRRVMRFDVNANVQLADFALLPVSSIAYALRILSDGGILVADTYNIKRLDASGTVIMTYDVTGEDSWFSLNLDPNATSFWSGNYNSANFYKFDIATGGTDVHVLGPINTGTGSSTLWGLTVYGEITAAVEGIPDQCVAAGEQFALFDLDDYAVGVPPFSWTWTGDVNITVNIDGQNVVTLTYPGGWTGSETITFTGTDSLGSSDSDDATFTVDPVPVVGDIPDQTAPFVPFDLDVHLSGIAPGLVTWTASGMVCLQVTIDGNHVVTVTNPGGVCTQPETITFTATAIACGDTVTDEDDATFTPNLPPECVCIEPCSVEVHKEDAVFYFEAFDQNDDDLDYLLQMVGPTPFNPPVATITDDVPGYLAGFITWTPNCIVDKCIWYHFELKVTDGVEWDTCHFRAHSYNQPPWVNCPPDEEIHGDHDTYVGNFTYGDPEDDHVDIRLDIQPDPPTNADPQVSYDNGVGTVTWTPNCEDNGTQYTIILWAIDQCEDSSSCSFVLTVTNEPPWIVCPQDEEIHGDHDTYVGNFTYGDPDGDRVTVEVDIQPDPPTSDDPQITYANGSGTVTWTPNCEDNGTQYAIVLTVIDTCQAQSSCSFVLTVTNDPPWITCPEDGLVHGDHDTYVGNFTYGDPEGDRVTVDVDIQPDPPTSSDPEISYAGGSGTVSWTPNCEDIGTEYTIVLTATDTCQASSSCSFTLTVTNEPPFFTSVPASSETLHAEHSRTYSFTADDPEGDPICSMDISATLGTISGITPSIPPCRNSPVTVSFTYTAPSVEQLTNVDICIMVDDTCEAEAETCFTVHIKPLPRIIIPNTDSCVNPGEYVCLPILLRNNTSPFGGFELEVEFDYTAMTFVGVEPGELIEGFEKFTYRLLPCPACGCCKYKILLYGQYDMPNGVENVGEPIPRTPMGEFGELVSLCFVVNNDENLRGLKIPVCWEWEGEVVNDTLVEDWNCAENTFSSWSGDTLFTSKLLCQFKADLCDAPTDRIRPILVFQDGVCGQNCGGIDICPAGPGLCKRGDINMNDMTHEVADAVLFASYFVEGTSVFRYDEPYQICATDVNADGRTLTLSDLVYLIRVILHDAVELPKLTPSSEVANVIVSNGTISTECASPIGGILFEFDSAVSPTLLADMEMVSKHNKVLVWSREGKSFGTAEVLSFTGEAELVSATAVDRDSRELTTTITAKVAPTAFALYAAYPNPFNPFTNLSFNLPEAMNYSLKIYNVAGQLVRSYEGVGSQNLNVVTWDGKDNSGSEVSSGVYFYKLTAAGFSATEKMVMMK